MDFIQAFISFLTDIFAAIAEFLGGEFVAGDILGEIGGLIGGEDESSAE